MIALARTSRNCKITASVQQENKIIGCESQGACRQDELMGGKPPVVKELSELLLTREFPEGSQSRQTVKYGCESRGTLNQEAMCWRRPAAIQQSAVSCG
jgi:hypothetical protein